MATGGIQESLNEEAGLSSDFQYDNFFLIEKKIVSNKM